MSRRIVAAYLPAAVLLTMLAGPLPAQAPAAREEESVAAEKARELEADVTQGALRMVRPDGAVVECPLRHTDVQADVSGFIARVRVTQTFYNPSDERIEAVYVFPLPHQAAVDEMTMVLGERKIVGLIKRRLEARQIYQAALAAGHTAALLEQERPNIFTQSVGNIEPGQEVRIEIGYVDVLDYDLGRYEFHFPMVVGPRFNPGAPIASPAPTPAELQGAVSPPVPDTTRVPDASRISPPVLRPGFRNGHDISLTLRLDAGVPIQELEVANHEAEVVRQDQRRAEFKLSPADSIPNKDFVLRYHVVGKKPEMAVLSHTGDAADSSRWGPGYFLLMVQPKEDERLTKSPPREIVFLLDVSGSMSGQPTEKVKEAMSHMLALCREVDTLQVITFASRTDQLFQAPVPVTRENVARALNFTQALRGGGGTHMLEGVKRAIDQPLDPQRVRIVIMLTDGYIGNEAEIIQHVGEHAGDQVRFWAVGIGSSPNMFLIDGVARQGGGAGQRLGLEDNAAGLAEEVITRIQRAQLAQLQIDWGGLQVSETYPAKLPELWAGRPVIVFGRYAGGGQAEIQVKGVVEGEPVQWPLQVDLPETQPDHEVLAKVWARRKIEDLMHQTFYAGSPAVEEEVTAIALDYGLMTQYTSFVAVDAKEAEQAEDQPLAQPPRRMLVPVPLPEGTRWEGFFGPLGEPAAAERQLSLRDGAVEFERLGRLNTHNYYGAPGLHQQLTGFALSPTPAPAAAAPARQAGAVYSASEARPAVRLREMRFGGIAVDSLAAVPQVGREMAAGLRGFGGGIGGGAFGLEADEFSRGARGDRFQFRLGDLPTQGWDVLPGDAEGLLEPAAELLKPAGEQPEETRPAQTEAALTRAYLLATAAANRGSHGGELLAAQALAALETARQERLELWQKQLPALKTRLQLVLRDQSVDAALQAIAKAAGLKIELVPGSLEDAREMLAGQPARITYLDLRGASAAQALDWVLLPLRLTWRVPEEPAGAILAGSDRRLPGAGTWVYDVSAISHPGDQELAAAGDAEQQRAAAKAEAEQFLEAVRRALRGSAEEIVWFAPGQLLVSGVTERHTKAAELFARLADPAARLPEPLAALHAKTSRRAAEHRDAQQSRRADVGRLAVAGVHQQYGWQLLAAAYGGSLDIEAATELQLAWRAEETEHLLKQSSPGLALRSGWAVIEASRLLPEERELAELASAVRHQVRSAAAEAVAAFQENRQDVTALLTALYGCLAAGDAELAGQLLAGLDSAPADASLAAATFAARQLLDERPQTEATSLLAGGGVVGDDLTTLVAVACRRAGGDAWSTFRAARGEVLGKQPLDGNIIVLINRL